MAQPSEVRPNFKLWSENPFVADALVIQGYAELDTEVDGKYNLKTKKIRALYVDFFKSRMVSSSDMDPNDKIEAAQANGATAEDLIRFLLPDFIEETTLSEDEEDEVAAWRSGDIQTHEVDVVAFHKLDAVAALSKLVNGSICSETHTSSMQTDLRKQNLILIQVPDELDDNDNPTVLKKVVTNDHYLICEYYAKPRGVKAQQAVEKIEKDLKKVVLAFPGIEDQMREALEASSRSLIGSALSIGAANLEALGLQRKRSRTALSSVGTR